VFLVLVVCIVLLLAAQFVKVCFASIGPSDEQRNADLLEERVDFSYPGSCVCGSYPPCTITTCKNKCGSLLYCNRFPEGTDTYFECYFGLRNGYCMACALGEYRKHNFPSPPSLNDAINVTPNEVDTSDSSYYPSSIDDDSSAEDILPNSVWIRQRRLCRTQVCQTCPAHLPEENKDPLPFQA
jgi:hypothetical protein